MYDTFNHPLVRDMAWVASAPPLLRRGILPIRDPLEGSILRSDPERLSSQLRGLDGAPEKLSQLMGETRDRRLGNHYERLWHALLELAPDVEILGRNIKLYREGVTLGELDLIVRTAEGSIAHVELAIKFYVGRPELATSDAPTSPHTAWWGPDPRDQLAHKVDRLLRHQLPLAAALDLAREPYPRPDFSCAWLQGQLFMPAFATMPAAPDAADTVNIWCRQSDLARLGGAQWRVMQHKQWLAPPPPTQGPRTTEELMVLTREVNQERARPVMAICVDSGDSAVPTGARLMCMPDSWPDAPEVNRWKSDSAPSTDRA
jgi:hypothetical protein